MFDFLSLPGNTESIFLDSLRAQNHGPQTSFSNVVDFTQDDLFYFGRTDPVGNAVILSEVNLSQLQSPGSDTLFAVDFVADAFNDFRNYYNAEAASAGALSTDTRIGIINPKSAWESTDQEYDGYIAQIYNIFVGGYLKDGNREQKLHTFKDFLDLFFKYLDFTAGATPFSYTGYLLSRDVSPAISGLFINTQTQTETDLDLVWDWFNDNNFSFYVNTARKFGFNINARQPWQLVASLGSEPMRKYMSAYGVNPDNLYDEYYLPTFMLDVPSIKLYTREFYDTYRLAYPAVTSVKGTVCAYQKNRIGELPIPEIESLYSVDQREIITGEGYATNYGAIFWLIAYFNLRVKEARIDWSKNTHFKILKKAIKFQKGFDFRTALRYINEQVKANTPRI